MVIDVLDSRDILKMKLTEVLYPFEVGYTLISVAILMKLDSLLLLGRSSVRSVAQMVNGWELFPNL